MAFKKSHAALSVGALAAAGVLAWWLQNRTPVGDTERVVAALGQQAATSGAASGVARGSGAAGAGATASPGGAQGPAAVEVGKVERLRIEDDAQAVGSLRARQGVVMRPEVSGRIAHLTFSDGQRVRRGQLLVQLDDTLQKAQAQQAEAQASIARTNLKRSRELLAQNFISQSAVDQNAAALEVADAQVALAQAQLARMRIVAPFDGGLGIRTVNVGDYVKDGADLVTIEDIGALWADFRLPESTIARLRVGQPVEVTLESLPGRKFMGRVDALDSQLDANGRSMLVRARIDNRDGVLRSGMFARARVLFAVREDALVVPEEALVPLGDRQFLFKVVDGPNGKVAQKIEARIGVREPGKAEITQGEAVGDLVVTAGQTRLLRGDLLPVRVVDLNKVGSEAGPRGPGRGASGATPGAAPGAARPSPAGGASGNSGAGSAARNGSPA